MDATEFLKELKLLNDRLTGMLADPHPGLITWVNAVHSILLQMHTLQHRSLQ